MIYAILLLASVSWGQEISTTTPSIPLLDQIEISNLGKDTRALLSGRYTQTGKPTFQGGICFKDGTCQTTAGGALTSTQTFGGANTFTATTTLGSVSGGITVPVGTTPTGIAVRVDYSSGAWGSFSFVLQATVTYNLEFSLSITSGTSSARPHILCRVNGDAGANYLSSVYTYPNGYQNSYTTSIGLADCGTGAVNATDFLSGSLRIAPVWGGNNSRISFSGTTDSTCQTITVHNASFLGGFYNSAVSAPWTIKCFPESTMGWTHEAILYRVGK